MVVPRGRRHTHSKRGAPQVSVRDHATTASDAAAASAGSQQIKGTFLKKQIKGTAYYQNKQTNKQTRAIQHLAARWTT